jgi:hypothetical protein
VDWSRQNQQNTYSSLIYFANRSENRSGKKQSTTTYQRLAGGNLATSACNFLRLYLGRLQLKIYSRSSVE